MVRRTIELRCENCDRWFKPDLQLIRSAIDLLPKDTKTKCKECGKQTEYSAYRMREV